MADTGTVVLDTNIVLDMLLFEDASTQPLRRAIGCGTAVWLATPAMREELVRVLDYAHLRAWADRRGKSMRAVLEDFDALARVVREAPLAVVRCSDPDDQKFIDLAVQHRACLWSKDRAVRARRRGLANWGATLR